MQVYGPPIHERENISTDNVPVIVTDKHIRIPHFNGFGGKYITEQEYVRINAQKPFK